MDNGLLKSEIGQMGCAKSKPEVAPEELPVLDADEEERKQRLESAVLARREADARGQNVKQRTGDPSALLPAQEGVVLAPVEATLVRDTRPGLEIKG